MNDTIAIEKKAINRFEGYLENSEILSAQIDRNDKTPCWDGHLYVFQVGYRDKDHLVGRISVQIKGKEVDVLSDNLSWPVKLADLRAYLNNPTVYVVAQLLKNSKDCRLFYFSFLPMAVRKLLEDTKNVGTINVHLSPIPDDCGVFDDLMDTFLVNSQKQLSFNTSKMLLWDDLSEFENAKLQIVEPSLRGGNPIEKLSFLTCQPLSVYLKTDKDYMPDVPLPQTDLLTIQMPPEMAVTIDGVVYYEQCSFVIEHGVATLTLGNTISMQVDLLPEGKQNPRWNWQMADTLRDFIRDAEFYCALAHGHLLKIGPFEINLEPSEMMWNAKIEKHILFWKELQQVLNRMHVRKDLLWKNVPNHVMRDAQALVDSVLHGKKVRTNRISDCQWVIDLGNVKLMVCCMVSDGYVRMCDFFDPEIDMYETLPDGSTRRVDALEYARRENLCSVIDNVPEGE